MKTIIGLDAGKGGGIAWIKDGQICAENMPETIRDLWDLIEHITKDHAMIHRATECVAYLEQVASSPQMGVVSAFSFGNNFGHLEMALTAANVKLVRVAPSKWQKAMGCRTGGDKNITKTKAQELFPSIKITHKVADALLIAEYGRREER